MPTKWIEEKEQQEEIIKTCDSCALAMVDQDGKPYVVIMNYGYKDGYMYFHGDPKGKKMDILRQNPNVSITMSTGHSLYHQNENVACSYGMNYKSVLAEGVIEFVEDLDSKTDALNIIMSQYTAREFSYNDPAVKQVCIFKVKLTNLKAKNFGRFVR